MPKTTPNPLPTLVPLDDEFAFAPAGRPAGRSFPRSTG